MDKRVPVVLGLIAAPALLIACATAYGTAGSSVAVAQETAVIVWDPQTKTEHFIRRASFETRVKDFAFIVPTPTLPQLAKADDDAFDALDALLEPEVLHRELKGYKLTTNLFAIEPDVLQSVAVDADDAAATAGTGGGFEESAPPPVEVVRTEKVAGYDATVLKASDTGALVRWLRNHGYASRPALEQWLEPYVQEGWALTAFKVSGDKNGRAETSAVRMTFKTDRPFYPYREPADASSSTSFQGSRLLRVHFLAPARIDGVLENGRPWGAKVVRAESGRGYPEDYLSEILGLPANTMPAGTWHTAFEDRAPHRAGAGDLYFPASSSHQAVKVPPTYVDVDKRTEIPLSTSVPPVLLTLWLFYRMGQSLARRRKTRPATA